MAARQSPPFAPRPRGGVGNAEKTLLVCTQVPIAQLIGATELADLPVQEPPVGLHDRVIAFENKQTRGPRGEVVDKAVKAGSPAGASVALPRSVVHKDLDAQFNDGSDDLTSPSVALLLEVNPSLPGHDEAVDRFACPREVVGQQHGCSDQVPVMGALVNERMNAHGAQSVEAARGCLA
jgi:hypothetical protein